MKCFKYYIKPGIHEWTTGGMWTDGSLYKRLKAVEFIKEKFREREREREGKRERERGGGERGGERERGGGEREEGGGEREGGRGERGEREN